MARYLRIAITIIMAVLCAGCFLWTTAPPERETPESLYEKGHKDYQEKNYKEAIESFQRLKEEYPLSTYAISAELGIADSYYHDEDYISAEAVYREFIDFHPTNDNLPYVVYQIGMCHFSQMLDVDRDQTETRLAKESFEKVIARYPTSTYSFTAEQKLRDCRKRLGEHEFYVGEYYFNRENYRAALSRFEIIARDYSNLGLDYKVSYYIHETRRLLSKEEKKGAD